MCATFVIRLCFAQDAIALVRHLASTRKYKGVRIGRRSIRPHAHDSFRTYSMTWSHSIVHSLARPLTVSWRTPCLPVNPHPFSTVPLSFMPDSSSRASSLTWMSPLSSIELHWSSVPLAILIDPCLSTNLPPAFMTDSSSGVSSLTWMSPLSSIELHWSSVPLVILIDPCLSKQRGVQSDLDESIELDRAAL